MNLASVVQLPTGEQPLFPDACVRCLARSPLHHALLITRDVRHGMALWLGWHVVRVPACSGCAVVLHVERTWRFLRSLILGAAALSFGFLFMLPRYSGLVSGLVTLGLIFLLLFASAAIDQLFPPPFNFERSGQLVVYEFTSDLYASEFAALNDAAPVA